MNPDRPRILVVLGHPRGDSLCAGLADAYAAGARAEGAEVTVLRLGETDFDLASREPSLLRWHGRDQVPAREPAVEQMIDDVRDADHLVFIFPQWWGTYPALLKGYIDRVFLSRFAFAYREGSSLWDKRLTGRTARVLMTMDSPLLWDTLKYRRAAVTSLTQAVLGYCGVRTVGVTRFPRVRFSTEARRAAWLARVEQMGRKDARRTPRAGRPETAVAAATTG